MPDHSRITDPDVYPDVYPQLTAPDNLVAVIEGIDEMVNTFKNLADLGVVMTVEQILEHFLPAEDLDRDALFEHSHALAISCAIMMQRGVMCPLGRHTRLAASDSHP